MKNFLLYIFFKNLIGLLVIKFINKLIKEKDISAYELYYLVLQLDLTNVSCLVGNISIQLLEKLTCVLSFIDKKNFMPKDANLERYCSRDMELQAKALYKIHRFYY